MRRLWLIAALWVGAACVSAQALPPAPSPEAVPVALAERQILLMLRVAPSHYRPDANYADSYTSAPGREARRRIARSIARQHGLQLRTDWPMQALGLDCFVLDAPDAATVERVVRQLQADARVESVQAMQQFHVLADADPLYAAQPAASDWHLSALHEVATGKGVLVAVVDSGVALAHPDLRGQVASARNFVDERGDVPESHGTEVAGIIAARAGNGIGIVGIAPQSRLLALRACSQGGDGAATCSSFSLAKALQFTIDRDAQVLNMSLSGPQDRLLARLLDAAIARGIVVVGAVDIEASDGGFPASHPGVLAVAQANSAQRPTTALSAPGQGIPTTRPDGGWGLVSGSSFAAAQVSGLAALLRQLEPRLEATRMRDVLAPAAGLRLTTERTQPIDACAAVSRVDGRCACNCATTSSASMETPRQ